MFDLVDVQLLGALRLGGQLLVSLQAGLALRLPALRVRPDPLELSLQDLLPLRVLLPSTTRRACLDSRYFE